MAAKKKKTKKKQTPAKNTTSWWRWLGGGLLALALLAGLLGLGGWAASALAQHAQRSSGLSQSTPTIDITPAPAWLTKHALSTFALPKLLGRPVRLTDPNLVTDLGQALKKSPWVDSVLIQRQFQKLSIQITYRTPVLVLPWKEFGCYMDAHARVVPAQQADPAILKKCLIVEGVSVKKLPAVGESFSDVRLDQSAKLAAFLQPYHDKFQFLALVIDAGQDNRDTCSIKTRRGSRVVWGQLNEQGTPSDIENRWKEKIARLETLHEPLGTLDPPQGPMEFDVSKKVLGRPTRLVDKARQHLPH